MPISFRQAVIAAAVIAGLAAVPACAGPAPAGKPTVAVAFFPIADAARTIAADAVQVVDLTPPGASPHDIELSPAARAAIQDSAAVIYLGAGFQPQVERVVAERGNARDLDLLTTVPLLPVDAQLGGLTGQTDGEQLAGGKDPHVWVSPHEFSTMITQVADTLSTVAPAAATEIKRAGDTYLAALNELDQQFRTRLRGCASTALVTSHRAFGYLAHDYGLQQIAIAGLSPDEEPNPRDIAVIAAAARQRNATTVFFEEALPPNLANTVATEIGARTDLLSPLETLDPQEIAGGDTYLSLQRRNLDKLVEGLRCTG